MYVLLVETSRKTNQTIQLIIKQNCTLTNLWSGFLKSNHYAELGFFLIENKDSRVIKQIRTVSLRSSPCKSWRISRNRSKSKASYSTSLSSSLTFEGTRSLSWASIDAIFSIFLVVIVVSSQTSSPFYILCIITQSEHDGLKTVRTKSKRESKDHGCAYHDNPKNYIPTHQNWVYQIKYRIRIWQKKKKKTRIEKKRRRLKKKNSLH